MSETSSGNLSNRLNWLRAGVLGANDGIVSTAGLVFGVAGATTNTNSIIIAGLAGLVAGALSMAGGEYVSVSSQRDTELSATRKTQQDFNADPALKRQELAESFVAKGISTELADQVVAGLSDKDVEQYSIDALGIDAEAPVSPWVAARASMLSFTIGSLIPLLAMVFTPADFRLSATIAAVITALFITGYTAAKLSGVSVVKPILRNVVVGFAAMNITYLVGMGVDALVPG
ncbi:MAG: VIT family protein [Propionibacteriaceae bacterium]|nr:VIT family protein [Propionibacteriaceae bacterium]